MTIENRRYPRLSFGEPGALDVEGERIDVAIRDLSCEGAGVDVVAPDKLKAGGVVTLSFAVPEGEVSLSARVVWIAGGRAGLRLRLAESDPGGRKLFGAWVAPRTKQALKDASASS